VFVSNGGVHHVPVLATEVMDALAPAPGQTVVDATIGVGGHAKLLMDRLGPDGRLVGLDRDARMLALLKREAWDVGREASPHARPTSHAVITLVEANFDQLRSVLDHLGIEAADGVLADLGVCSDQLDDAERGFSFQQCGPLDMRMDTSGGEPAGALLGRLSERGLADLFWQYGEERFSRRIARKIVERRRREPLTTTDQLAELVRRCVPRRRGRQSSIDPATRVFQALRIAVNDELGALERFLSIVPDCVKPGGRVVVISFHSLEDRRVKQAFRRRELWTALTPKPIQAGEAELRTNPRARSAKLRAAKRR
jgi:16S rRNA (cytosine1402-N4)-methyltransferase